MWLPAPPTAAAGAEAAAVPPSTTDASRVKRLQSVFSHSEKSPAAKELSSGQRSTLRPTAAWRVETYHDD